MPDILLVQPPIRDFYLTAKRTVPYGLASIAASCIAEGFSVEILDALASSRQRDIEWPEEMAYLKAYYGRPDATPFALFHRYRHYGYSFEHLGKMARQSGAFLVGISSLFTPYSGEALKTAAWIKGAHPTCQIVMGGHHPTEMPQHAMQCPSVDFVIRGDGEKAMPLLATALKMGFSLDDIPGIVYRDEKGEMIAARPHRINDPEDFLLPATHLINHRYYKRGTKGSTVIVASRGCPGRCSYCCMRQSHERHFIQRPVELVLEEIDRAVKRDDSRFIDFEDENLSLNRRWFMALLHEIIIRFNGANLELRCMNGLFPPTLDTEVINAMAKAGFKALNLSLGSSSPAQLRRFHRVDVRDAFESALAAAQRCGLQVIGYVIVGAPDQSAESSLKDLIYLAQRRTLAGVSIFYPAPGALDYLKCGDLGVLPQSFALMRSSAIPIDHRTTRLNAVTLLRLGRILNFMKALLDQSIPIPIAQPYPPGIGLQSVNRMKIGLKLLSWFLHDGQIRGVAPDGEVYNHKVSPELTGLFLEEIQKINLKGSQ
jgi:hypothetical protein